MIERRRAIKREFSSFFRLEQEKCRKLCNALPSNKQQRAQVFGSHFSFFYRELGGENKRSLDRKLCILPISMLYLYCFLSNAIATPVACSYACSFPFMLLNSAMNSAVKPRLRLLACAASQRSCLFNLLGCFSTGSATAQRSTKERPANILSELFFGNPSVFRPLQPSLDDLVPPQLHCGPGFRTSHSGSKARFWRQKKPLQNRLSARHLRIPREKQHKFMFFERGVSGERNASKRFFTLFPLLYVFLKKIEVPFCHFWSPFSLLSIWGWRGLKVQQYKLHLPVQISAFHHGDEVLAVCIDQLLR